MDAVITKANREWSSRPADERFGSLQAIHSDAVAARQRAASAKVLTKDLFVIEENGDVLLSGKSGSKAKLNNWSFGQLCSQAKAPSAYLKTLPSGLVVSCLNNTLTAYDDQEHESALLFDRDQGLTATAVTSTKYSRIWDQDITQRCLQLEAQGIFQPAPAAFDGSRGLYRGDRDMFIFMVDNARRIFEKDPNGGLSRGFFCWNSQVGARGFGGASFLYEWVCGNHRIWGVKEYSEFNFRHVGDVDERGFAEFAAKLVRYADGSAGEDESKIVLARTHSFGATKDAVLDTLFKTLSGDVSRKVLETSYTKAVEHEDWYGSPNTAWGITGGMTEVARDLPNADDRTKLDRAAAKVLEMVF